MKVQIPNNLTNLTKFEDFSRFCSAFISDLVSKINGNLSFKDNIKASGPTIVGFTNSSQIVGITHSLGVIPSGFLVINQTSSASVYAPQNALYAWNSSLIYLQASAGTTATIFII